MALRDTPALMRGTAQHSTHCRPLPRHLGRSWVWLLVLVQVIHGGRLELQGIDQDVGLGGKIIWEERQEGTQAGGGMEGNGGAAQGGERAPRAGQEVSQGPIYLWAWASPCHLTPAALTLHPRALCFTGTW